LARSEHGRPFAIPRRYNGVAPAADAAAARRIAMEETLFRPLLKNEVLVGTGLLIGRLWMAVLFIIFGMNKLVHTDQMQDYMRAHNGSVPVQLIYLAMIVQIGCGVLLALGYQTRFAALMLAGFCIIATSLFHTDFNAPGELAHFTKDFAIAGGFLFMIAYGPDRFSLDAYLGRRRSLANTRRREDDKLAHA
jgi:putative oxidoreductase